MPRFQVPTKLAEFTDDRGDSGQRVYFTELLKTQALDTGILRQVLAQASREMDSDYELASLLIDNARTFISDDPTRQAHSPSPRSRARTSRARSSQPS